MLPRVLIEQFWAQVSSLVQNRCHLSEKLARIAIVRFRAEVEPKTGEMIYHDNVENVAEMVINAVNNDRLWLTDFATIFAHMWYRDFPLQRSSRDKAQRADWTTHLGITVRSTADLMGLFTCFESGRTDAVLRDTNEFIAALEWEWDALHTEKVKEFEQLMARCREPKFESLRFAGLVVYGRTDGKYSTRTEEVLEQYEKNWPSKPPLLLVVIDFESIGKDELLQRRQFQDMRMYEVGDGAKKLLRRQPAFPWNVSGSRWARETASGE